MGLTTRKHQSQIVPQGPPYYYMVHLEGEHNCKTRCCGSESDVEMILNLYPGSRVEKIYPPSPPQTVDVPHFRVAPDLELPMQQSLPQSEAIKLEL